MLYQFAGKKFHKSVQEQEMIVRSIWLSKLPVEILLA